jgi:hypothetical protein
MNRHVRDNRSEAQWKNDDRPRCARNGHRERREGGEVSAMNYPHPMDDKTGFEATDEQMGLAKGGAVSAMTKRKPDSWMGPWTHDMEWHENKKRRRMEVAAPEMLAALKEARDIIANYWPLSTPESEPEKSTIAAINKIEAAIRAAEGEA